MNLGPVGDATYELVVRGELDRRFAYLFEGMEMRSSDSKTVLIGTVRDQAQLHALIERIEELGLELVSVQQKDGGQPTDGERNHA